MSFEALFGLKINLEKSEIIPVGRVENIESWLKSLNVGLELSHLLT